MTSDPLEPLEYDRSEVAPDVIEKIDLEVDMIRTLARMTGVTMNDRDAMPEEWTYFEPALQRHLGRIEQFLKFLRDGLDAG